MPILESEVMFPFYRLIWERSAGRVAPRRARKKGGISRLPAPQDFDNKFIILSLPGDNPRFCAGSARVAGVPQRNMGIGVGRDAAAFVAGSAANSESQVGLGASLAPLVDFI